MRILCVILCLAMPAAWAHDSKPCERLLLAENERIAHEAARAAEQELRQRGARRIEARGYAILIGTMVGTAAATTYLSSSLPQGFQFLSHLLAQVSTLGIYVFGAPIWEPLSSGFRKLAFGVRGSHHPVQTGEPEFERLWRRTQEHYSLNAQMSRNVISQFIISVQNNFYEAHRAIHARNPVYAADQIAEAAFRLRTLFKDVPPGEPAVAAVVRSAFTHHVTVDAAFIGLVSDRLRRLDAKVDSDEARDYYELIIAAWLGPRD